MLIGAGIAVVILAFLYIIIRAGEEGTGYLVEENGRYEVVGYDISFGLPEGYKTFEVTDSVNSRHSVVLTREDSGSLPENGEGPTSISIDIFEVPVTTDVEQWIRNTSFSNFNLATGEITDTVIDTLLAKRYSWDGLYSGRSVVLEHNGRIIMASGTYLTPQDPIYADFERVISSIRLGE